MNPPAGFWKRYVAYFIDWLLLGVAVQLVAALPLALLLPDLATQLLALQAAAEADPRAVLADLLELLFLLAGLSTIAYAVLAAPYFVLMESSAWQATLGKRALGIIVTDDRGGRLGRGRAGARFLAATLSWLTLNLGHALAAWSRDKRALHDRLAGTRVLDADPAGSAMPGWGWAIVALHGLGFLLVTGLLALALVAVLMLPGALT